MNLTRLRPESVATIVLTLLNWIVAMRASCDESDEPHGVEKPVTTKAVQH
jgi:hypothetical protein